MGGYQSRGGARALRRGVSTREDTGCASFGTCGDAMMIITDGSKRGSEGRGQPTPPRTPTPAAAMASPGDDLSDSPAWRIFSGIARGGLQGAQRPPSTLYPRCRLSGTARPRRYLAASGNPLMRCALPDMRIALPAPIVTAGTASFSLSPTGATIGVSFHVLAGGTLMTMGRRSLTWSSIRALQRAAGSLSLQGAPPCEQAASWEGHLAGRLLAAVQVGRPAI